MSLRKRNLNEKELLAAIEKVERELHSLREMKRLLAIDGIKPDEEDRARESKLIQKKLGYEKDLKRLKKKPGQPAEKAAGKYSKAKQKQPLKKGQRP